MWFSVFLGVMSAMQQVSAAKEQRKAAREAEALANENARMTEAEGEREQQITRQAQGDVEARQRALVAASGVSGKSQSMALADTEERHAGNLAWMQKATESRASIERAGGQIAKSQGMAAASSTMAGAFGSFGGAANTWYSMR